MINIEKLQPNKTYTMTTKYPYELDALITDVRVSGVLYDYTIASMLEDVVSKHKRISQINSNVKRLEELRFLVLRTKENNIIVMADDYIEDIIEV